MYSTQYQWRLTKNTPLYLTLNKKNPREKKIRNQVMTKTHKNIIQKKKTTRILIMIYSTKYVNNISMKFFLKCILKQYLVYLTRTLNLFIKIMYFCYIMCKTINQ